MPWTLDVHCARLKIGNGIFIMHSLCPGVVPALAFPTLASATSVVACIRIDHLNTLLFAPIPLAHRVGAKKNVACLKSMSCRGTAKHPSINTNEDTPRGTHHVAHPTYSALFMKILAVFNQSQIRKKCVRCIG